MTPEAKDSLKARKDDLGPLPEAGLPLCLLGLKQDFDLGQGFHEIFAALGEVPQEPPGDTVSQSRLNGRLACRCKREADSGSRGGDDGILT
jgi:hypothetical protein